MFNLQDFISEHITHRRQSFFAADMEHFHNELAGHISGRSVLVIGGAGTIGSSFIKALLPFKPARLVVIDVSENGLTELTRDLRSTHNLFIPEEYKTYPVSFADPVFEKIFRHYAPFDIVANFAAHKHVRSEKDIFSISALLHNNVLNAGRLLSLLAEAPPRHFFCVSTDKATNPANIMGASKKLMEDLIMVGSLRFKVSTARFANVAFSNGSLPEGFLNRLARKQPLSAPSDVKRYFVSPEESGQICLLACLLGENRDIFFPKLSAQSMLTFSEIAESLLKEHGLKPLPCASEEEARRYAATRHPDDPYYPVYFFASDTSGEKPYEEFYAGHETIDMERFSSLGVIKNTPVRSYDEMQALLEELASLLARADVTKEQVVQFLEKVVPGFRHIETGKNLDQKM